MLASERRRAILREIELRGEVVVTAFAARHGVSEMTIRRDLGGLEAQGLVERVHGGAVRRRTGDPVRSMGPIATIGMVVPSAFYYFPAVIAGAKAAAAEAHVRLVLAVSEYHGATERHQIARLLENGVDGLVVTPAEPFSVEPDTYGLLASVPVPVVVMERSLTETPAEMLLGAVRTDHAHGARLAVRHFVDTGRTRIALVARDEGPTPYLVREGYRRAMDELIPGGEILELTIVGADGSGQQRDSYVRIIDEVIASGADALLVVPDAAAVALFDLASDRGVAVPEDLAIVAYDDEIASLATMPLTAVAPPKEEMGGAAVRACFDLITRETPRHPVAHARVNLLPSLAVRESTPVRRVPGS